MSDSTPPDAYCFTIATNDDELTICYASQEMNFLGGKTDDAIEGFVIALGMWDNFSVAGGMDAAAWTTKDRLGLLNACTALLATIECQAELYAHDYWYRLPGSRSRIRSTLVIELPSGESGLLRAKTPGQFYLDVTHPSPGVVDLRAHESFLATNVGVVRVDRKPNNLRWRFFLPRVCAFLEATPDDAVRVRHHKPIRSPA